MTEGSDAREEWTAVLGNPSALQRIWWRLRFIPAWAWLILTLRSRRTRELWIGDSHAMTFNQGMESGNFMRANGGLVIRAGARLMYSIGAKGFPPFVLRIAGVIGRWSRPGTYVPLYLTGEIDVRTQMANRPDDDLGWVDRYLQRCLELSAIMRAPISYIVAPPPPCELEDLPAFYPVSGTIEERLHESRRLRAALRAAVAQHDNLRFIDLTEFICDDRGQLRADLTDDGCHTNAAGVTILRTRIKALDLTQVN